MASSRPPMVPTRHQAHRLPLGFLIASDSIRPTAIDDMNLAGCKKRLVGGEISRQRGEFGRFAQASHGLALDEPTPLGGWVASESRHPFSQRRRVDCAGTDCVAAYAVANKISSD